MHLRGREVKKKVTPTVPDEPSYVKHVTTRTPVFAFNEAIVDRPLVDMGRAYITVPRCGKRVY